MGELTSWSMGYDMFKSWDVSEPHNKSPTNYSYCILNCTNHNFAMAGQGRELESSR